MMKKPVVISLIILSCAIAINVALGSITGVNKPDIKTKNDFYVGNREPLEPSPLIKLSIGSIKPQGWLLKQLQLEAEGFSGHLDELSGFLRKEGNAWLSPKGEGHSPWEELPYWLKGFGDLGYVLDDKRIIDEAKVWLEAAIASQREDGYFGPVANLGEGEPEVRKPDLWPNMIMLFALQSYYEYTGDKRVLDLMTKYFKWEMTIPDENFLEPFWQNQRASDNLYSVYWLYNRTGDKFLLDVAEKVHKNTADWASDVANWHGVNIAQCFREPGVYWLQAKGPKFIEAAYRNYAKVRDIYGQVPGGLYGADENCREGYTGPRQATETCSMVEMMLSCELLTMFTGDIKWADRCEDVAFNSFPASMTPDLKGLRYLTAPNLIISDQTNKAPGFQNGGDMLMYNPYNFRCCQHNVAHGWPYYAESLWFATPGNGIAAVFYAQSEVTAKVGDGTEVKIVEQTYYPFDENVEFVVSSPKSVQFPLYLRIPGWCDKPVVKINGKAEKFDSPAKPIAYIVINRQWANGDKVSLEMPMNITLTKWEKNNNSVSVNRGPLTYSLKIGEKYVRHGDNEKWPLYEIFPTTAWNYALIFDEKNLSDSFKVVKKKWDTSNQPFTIDTVPIELTAKAKKIPQWKQDNLGLVGNLQDSPTKSNEPLETVTLVPMGAARLRISSFPWIGAGANAKEWVEPPPAMASYENDKDPVSAISDGKVPKNSNDHEIPRFTWWANRGSVEWVTYMFKAPTKVSSVSVYWFEDLPGGGCAVPQSWRVLYLDSKEWKPVANGKRFGVEKDKFNEASFDPVTTTALRVEVQLQENLSGGILEVQTK